MLTYREAGVDVDAGNDLVQRIKGLNDQIGGFAGLYDLGDGRQLVASTDGVGTKLAIAIELGRYETIGQDLVAMCVNDLVTVGARPLFFLDYYATGKLDVGRAETVVRGIAAACREAGCLLLGGETAEMPGFYPDGKFDLAGFAVGMVDDDERITGRGIRAGDILIGLPSSGVHANGFSLVRAILARRGLSLGMAFDGRTLGEALLAPTVIYVRQVLSLLRQHPIKGLAHITGGGFDNLDRILPAGLAVRVQEGSWPVPPVFEFLQAQCGVSDAEMRRTFNMGIGMALVVDAESVGAVLASAPEAFVFGEIVGER